MPDSIPPVYQPPLDQLLKLGKPKLRRVDVDWRALGIGHEHVPELIRMATDEALHTGDGNSPVVYAPVHAWRVLACLEATEAIGPLLGLLRRVDEADDDWVADDLPCVLAAFGSAAIAPLASYLADAGQGNWARIAAARALGLVGKTHPEARGECVARLSAQLERFAEQTDSLNAFLISPLLDLHGVEAVPVMERAFAAGHVDETIGGDWEDVQIDLGLKAKRERPRQPNELTRLGDELRAVFPGVNAPQAASRLPAKVGRNDPCPCGSGKKFKKCCGA